MNKQETCIRCGSANIVKNGKTYYGKQNNKCRECGRQFVTNYSHSELSNDNKTLINRLLLERISLEGIVRVLKISHYDLYEYMDELYERTPQDLNVWNFLDSLDVDLHSFECENDEAWSYVGNKKNKRWIWIAMHRETRTIIGFYIGDRSKKGAEGLWASIPEKIREKAIYHTDNWDAYNEVFNKAIHKPSDKKKETNHIERFWATLRARCSRLVRKTLSFSKKEDRHEAAISYFIADHNMRVSLLI